MVLSSPALSLASAEDTFVSEEAFDDQPDFTEEPSQPSVTPPITSAPVEETPQITPTPGSDLTPTPIQSRLPHQGAM